MLFGKAKITKELYIDGMSCMHCAANVEKALTSLKEVSGVKVDLNGKKATVKLRQDIDNAAITSTVEALGYTVRGIK